MGNGKSEKTDAKKKSAKKGGVVVERFFTTPSVDPLDTVVYEKRTSAITNPDGSVVFKMVGAEVPAGWSQLASDIVLSNYFRKAGLYGDKNRGETSVRQVVYR
ncbi:MAG: vitamin B12-dependent ribonucleotide reductase, partial [Polyangiaceae bacterium]|nr:vitamin B12-dependent ribonucleotide reductase [Polyangiaceae bacterium]